MEAIGKATEVIWEAYEGLLTTKNKTSKDDK